MVVKAVIFDLDGTLVKFNLDYKAVRGEVREYLLKMGVPSSQISAKEGIFDMLKKTRIFLKNSGKSEETIEETRNLVLGIAEKYELEAARNTSLVPGAGETLKDLKRMGLKIGLFTLNSDKAANYILQRFQIGDFFGVTVPRNKVNLVKPNPEHLEMALKVLDVGPSESVVVGDSIIDMESAKELRAIAVGLNSSVTTNETLVSHGANYLITSIIDLPFLVDRINREEQTN